MQRPESQRLPSLQDISSRDGVREAVQKLHSFLANFLRFDLAFKDSVVTELSPLYGEFDYTPAAILNGAQAVITITVADAILGYTCDVAYSKDLLSLQMTSYVVDGSVKVVLKNDTGGSVTLTAGRFRAYVWARDLTT